MERDGFMVTYEKCGLQPISMEGTNLTIIDRTAQRLKLWANAK